MTYIAVIVESPTKCKTIEQFLGVGYKCFASCGHLRTMNDLNCIDFIHHSITFHDIPSKTRQISFLRKGIREASDVLLALDDDREGESIAWHVCDLFQLPLTTKRIKFHEITRSAITYAITNPTLIHMDVVYAQHTRQALDLLIGFKISPLLHGYIKTKKTLSAGRCQSPALKLIYENQLECERTSGRVVYTTVGMFTSKRIEFVLNHVFQEPDQVEEFLTQSLTFEHVYSCSDIQTKYKPTPIPWTTSTLQQACSSKLSISPKSVMESCQLLYEAGYITYMRTDNTHYCNEFLVVMTDYISKHYGLEFNKPNRENDLHTGAHEAIRPIYIEMETVELNPREQKIYTMIRNHTIETCMVPAKYNCIQAQVTTCAPYVYTHCAEQIVFPGWQIVTGYTKASNIAFLQLLKQGPISYHTLHSKVSILDLKTHYTEANLVHQLEKKGIGRPSTYAGIVDKLQERGYVKKTNVAGKSISCVEFKADHCTIHKIDTTKEYGVERGKLILEPLGRDVIQVINQHFGPIFQYDYTKRMEDTLDLIAKGECGWEETCQSCLQEINQSIPVSTLVSTEVLLVISKEATLRQGKYSPYIYYKTKRMKKPKFIPISTIPQSIQEAKEWLKHNHHIIV